MLVVDCAEDEVVVAISSRGRYSVRMLVFMASAPSSRVFTKQEIAEAEGLSQAYIQQLMTTLKAAGLVGSHRGKAGGFSLARDPETISVAEVLRVTEGPLVLSPCLGVDQCDRETGCPTQWLWRQAGGLLDSFFSGISIADVARGPGAALET
jgi:Rrf2 family cysteine metabolism transcriptional repressor